MGNLSIIFLTVYILFLPVFAFLICLAAKKRYKNYPLFSFWISNIGEKKKKSYLIFSISLFIFGILEVCFSFFLLSLLPAIFISKIAVFFFALAGVLTAGIVFFPIDKRPKAHEQVSMLLFISIFMAFAFAIYPLLLANAPKILLSLDFLVLAFSILLICSYLKLRTKYEGKELKNLAKIRREETSLVLESISLWEWLVFIFLIAWVFAAAAFILKI